MFAQYLQPTVYAESSWEGDQFGQSTNYRHCQPQVCNSWISLQFTARILIATHEYSLAVMSRCEKQSACTFPCSQEHVKYLMSLTQPFWLISIICWFPNNILQLCAEVFVKLHKHNPETQIGFITKNQHCCDPLKSLESLKSMSLCTESLTEGRSDKENLPYDTPKYPQQPSSPQSWTTKGPPQIPENSMRVQYQQLKR